MPPKANRLVFELTDFQPNVSADERAQAAQAKNGFFVDGEPKRIQAERSLHDFWNEITERDDFPEILHYKGEKICDFLCETIKDNGAVNVSIFFTARSDMQMPRPSIDKYIKDALHFICKRDCDRQLCRCDRLMIKPEKIEQINAFLNQQFTMPQSVCSIS